MPSSASRRTGGLGEDSHRFKSGARLGTTCSGSRARPFAWISIAISRRSPPSPPSRLSVAGSLTRRLLDAQPGAPRPGPRGRASPGASGAVLRAGPRGVAPRARPAALRRADGRGARARRRARRRDADRRREDADGGDAGGAQRAHRSRRARPDLQRLSGRRDAEWMGPIYRCSACRSAFVSRAWRPPTGARPIARTSPTSPRKRPASITCATSWHGAGRSGAPAVSLRARRRSRLADDRRGARPAGDRRQRRPRHVAGAAAGRARRVAPYPASTSTRTNTDATSS